MLSVFWSPMTCGPIRMPQKIRTTTWGSRGRRSAAQIIGASAAISDTANSV